MAVQPASADPEVAHTTAVDSGEQHRKGSVSAAAFERARRNTHVDVVEYDALLSDADRRLAELGYVQVRNRR